jgi:PEP-CTERM motif
MVTVRSRSFLVGAIVALLLTFPRFSDAVPIRLIDVIPNNLSGETGQQSESSLAVNPTNANQIVLQSGFTNYFSTANGGAAWSLFQNISNNDASLDWSPGGNAYTSVLNVASRSISTSTSTNPVTGAPLGLLPTSVYSTTTSIPDQPWVVTTRVAGTDHIYVGFNDLSLFPGRTASVRASIDNGLTWNNVVIEGVTPGAGQDGPPIRLAASSDGSMVYAAFLRWNSGSIPNFPGNVIVVRDDNGTLAFNALGINGVNASGNVTFPFSSTSGCPGAATCLGAERLGSGLAIAVDPNNGRKVFVAFDVVSGGSTRTIVVRSLDGGSTWTQVFTTTVQSGLPSLSVAANGTVGLLYTTLENGMLVTHFVQTTNDFATIQDEVLSRFVSNNPIKAAEPYIGDFTDLEAIGNVFFGTFSASNNANGTLAVFPQGITFLRNFTGTPNQPNFQLTNLTGGNVSASIDPFFFSEAAIAVPEPAALLLLGFGLLALAAETARRSLRS